jgi:hypothetical protein
LSRFWRAALSAALFSFIASAAHASLDVNEEALLLRPVRDEGPAISLRDDQPLEIRVETEQIGEEKIGRLTPESLRREFDERAGEELQKRMTEQLVIPNAPTEEAEFEKIRDLNIEQLNHFLAKKTWLLSKIGKGLRAIKIPARKVNRILLMLNSQFYGSARVLGSANVHGGMLTVNIPIGLAPPSKVAEALRQTRLGHLLPQRVGFFYLFGFGLGIHRVEENGRARLRLELFLDFHRLKSVKTFVAIAAAHAGLSMVYELRGPAEKLRGQILHVDEIAAGTFRRSETHFSVTISEGLAFPPFIQGLSIFQAEGRRYRIFSLPLTGFESLNFLEKFSSLWKTSGSVGLCRRVMIGGL